ncbi:MAG TPA: response regulator [Candidatus Paceibacterota bacterium]|jgi:CheY-like chemotaxis protein|nr:response regulator [Parcubacteria group bacterium]MDP6119523.1 response regulator [Candidatus Paceibacterota bacterium]HJN62877.1 response regulator [Candidatus Paceibacterota bacterium]|tara:strand:+ start:2322 stop:2714 length:393 start_codon:yes stop_codon:yes gene_type:complete
MSDKNTYKFLIVDDDEFLLDVYSVKFREVGHTVDTAFGGEEALEKIKKGGDYDAIILDIVMPGVDGFEFLSRLRKGNLAENAAVIVLTNHGYSKDIEKAKEFNIDGYIVKASTIPSEVLAEVLKIVSSKL